MKWWSLPRRWFARARRSPTTTESITTTWYVKHHDVWWRYHQLRNAVMILVYFIGKKIMKHFCRCTKHGLIFSDYGATQVFTSSKLQVWVPLRCLQIRLPPLGRHQLQAPVQAEQTTGVTLVAISTALQVRRDQRGTSGLLKIPFEVRACRHQVSASKLRDRGHCTQQLLVGHDRGGSK